MEEEHRRKLQELAGPGVRFDRPMRLYTTFRVGGPAAAMVRAGDAEVLGRVLAFAGAHDIPWMVLGKGSNLLVSDGGFPGVVVRLRGELAEVSVDEKGDALSAGGGALNRRILDRCVREGLGGLEFLAGIPGTAGGAVATNAGARGRDTGEVLEEAELFTGAGGVDTLPAGAIRFSYRSSGLPRGAVVTRVRFEVRREAPEAVKGRVDRNLENRRRTQPLEFPSAGSVFRNPPGGSAWRLVDEAGLRGMRIGGAEISQRHANFIVNRGGATAGEIRALMNLARETVLRRTGIDLEPEIRTVGF